MHPAPFFLNSFHTQFFPKKTSVVYSTLARLLFYSLKHKVTMTCHFRLSLLSEGKLLEARDHMPSFSTTLYTQRVFKECYDRR